MNSPSLGPSSRLRLMGWLATVHFTQQVDHEQVPIPNARQASLSVRRDGNVTRMEHHDGRYLVAICIGIMDLGTSVSTIRLDCDLTPMALSYGFQFGKSHDDRCLKTHVEHLYMGRFNGERLFVHTRQRSTDTCHDIHKSNDGLRSSKLDGPVRKQLEISTYVIGFHRQRIIKAVLLDIQAMFL